MVAEIFRYSLISTYDRLLFDLHSILIRGDIEICKKKKEAGNSSWMLFDRHFLSLSFSRPISSPSCSSYLWTEKNIPPDNVIDIFVKTNAWCRFRKQCRRWLEENKTIIRYVTSWVEKERSRSRSRSRTRTRTGEKEIHREYKISSARSMSVIKHSRCVRDRAEA